MAPDCRAARRRLAVPCMQRLQNEGPTAFGVSYWTAHCATDEMLAEPDGVSVKMSFHKVRTVVGVARGPGTGRGGRNAAPIARCVSERIFVRAKWRAGVPPKTFNTSGIS